MAKTKRAKKVDYKPNIKKLVKFQAALAAKNVEVVKKIDVERRVVQMIVRGKSLDVAATRAGITTQEAHKITKEVVGRWLTEQAFSAVELREIMARQLDAVLALAMHEAFPHPKVDEMGQPVMVKRCDCALPEGQTVCPDEGHMVQATSTPDIRWAGMIESVLDRKASLLGLNAAHKLEEQKVDLLKRTYVGVEAKVIDAL